MQDFLLGVDFRDFRVCLKDDVTDALMDSAEFIVQEALDLGKTLQRGFEVLRNGIDPVFSHRIRLDLFLVFVVFKSDIKLKALRLSEARLHHSVTRHLHHVLLLKPHLVFFYIVLGSHSVDIGLQKRFACAFLDFLHRKPDLFLALLH